MHRGVIGLLVGVMAFATMAEPAFAKRVRKKRVRIQSTPRGATVYLGDTQSTPLGRTPMRRRIPYGEHTFIFELPGYRTEKLQVSVRRRTRRVRVKMTQTARLDLRASNDQAKGATITIDGEEVGTLPYQGDVDPGRHQIEVNKTGFRPFTQWVELAGGQVWTLPILLVTNSDKVGTLFVAADVSNARIFIDGKERGETPQSLTLPAGPVLVEIRAPDVPPWSKQVEVKSNQKTIVEARLRSDGASGTLMVLSNVADTYVLINGKDSGTAPATLNNIPVGTHIIEGTAKGYAPFQTTATVKPREQTVVKMELVESKDDVGRISVRASVPGAIVFIDGGSQGSAPFESEMMPAGEHSVTVRAEGYEDFTKNCTIDRNTPCILLAEMLPLVPVTVLTNAPNAVLSIDGKNIGPLPFEGSIAAGQHKFQVTAPYHAPGEQVADLQPNQTRRQIMVELTKNEKTPEELAAEAEAKRKAEEAKWGGTSPYSGATVRGGQNTFDFMFGMPFLLQVRGTVGIVDGFAVSVFGRGLERNTTFGVTELGARLHAGYRPSIPFSMGVYAEGWGGTNFDGTTSFGGEGGGTLSLHFGGQGSFNLGAKYQFFQDEWTGTPSISRDSAPNGSQSGQRLIATVSLAIVGTDGGFIISGEAKVDGDNRQLYRQAFFGLFDTDPTLYGQLGFIYPF